MSNNQEKKVYKGIFQGHELVLASFDKQEFVDRETGQPTGRYYINVSFTDTKQIVVMTCPIEFENILTPLSRYNVGFNFSLDKKLKIVHLERL